MNFTVNKYIKKGLSLWLVLFLTIGMMITGTIETFADGMDIVTLGDDLSEEQQQKALDYFGVDPDTVDVIYITNQEERQYLEGVATEQQLGRRTISCSYVNLLPQGSGITITTENLSWVTGEMIRNALITAGIEDAKVVAYAPFEVSGTGALTGILKGFTDLGVEIDEEQKEIANEEIIVTGKLSDEILDEELIEEHGAEEAAVIASEIASGIVNEVKTEVIKEKPKNDAEIEKIIINITNNYGTTLSDEQIAELTSLMSKINKLDLDFDALKDTLNDVGDSIKESLGSYGNDFFEKSGNWFSNLWNGITDFFSNLWNGITDFFSGLFNKDDTSDNTSDDVTDDINEDNTQEADTQEDELEIDSTGDISDTEEDDNETEVSDEESIDDINTDEPEADTEEDETSDITE